MTENEAKSIKWMKCVRDDAVVTLDNIAKNEPNVSPMLYAGRKEKAETIIKGFEELEQYRELGTVREVKTLKESSMTGLELAKIAVMIQKLKKYEEIGTVEECREAIEKQRAKIPGYEGDGYSDGEMVYDTWVCPNCSESYEVDFDEYEYCPNCGQHIDRLRGEEE